MSTIILLEWSLSMLEPVIHNINFFPEIEKISHNYAPKQLSGLSLAERQQVSTASRLDLAITAIKLLAEKLLTSLSILNGSLQTESVIFATFDSASQFNNVSAAYGEFLEKLLVSINQSPPTKASYLSMLENLRPYYGNIKLPVSVIAFVSAAANLTAAHELVEPSFVSLWPLPGDSSLYFMPVGPRKIGATRDGTTVFQSMVAANSGNGDVVDCNENGVNLMFNALYKPFLATLRLGQLTGRVQLIPSPLTRRGGSNILAEDIQFLCVMERSAMDKLYPTRSYYVLPAPNQTNMDPSSLGLEPHFAPLMHATLKTMQGKVVLVSVGTYRYGYIETVEDAKTKKRSGLVLSLFPPGAAIAPGSPLVSENDVGHLVSQEEQPSYAQRDFTPVWTSSEAVCTDLGRIVRLARRLPDKMDLFYKEVNKVRLHALSSCNIQLLMFLADLLKRESQQATNPAGSAEMLHVVKQIKPDNQADVCGDLTASDGKVFPLSVE